MNSTAKAQQKANYSTPQQRARRKIAREVWKLYDDIARAAGYTPAERQTAAAIETRLYEKAGETDDTPHRINLTSIGEALTSQSDDPDDRWQTASRRTSHLFTDAIPREGYQIVTRYKAEEKSGKSHEYAGHLLPIATFFSELLAEEEARIRQNRSLDKEAKNAACEEARQRVITEALTYLPRCDTEIVLQGEVYARVSAPEAEAYCRRNEKYSARPYQYSPPPEKTPTGPLYSADLKRAEERIKRAIEKEIERTIKCNSLEEARIFSAKLERLIPKILASCLKVGEIARSEEGEESKELISWPEIEGGGPPIRLWKNCQTPKS